MAPPAAPPPPAAPDFDSAEYDAAPQQQQASSSGLGQQQPQESFEELFERFSLALSDHRVLVRGAEDAVDSCLAACLDVIEMQYPAREDDPVSAVSLQHGSWEAEHAPAPCSVDSWLRGALPDTAPTAPSTSGTASHSWAMQQFLAGQAAAAAQQQQGHAPSFGSGMLARQQSLHRHSASGLPEELAAAGPAHPAVRHLPGTGGRSLKGQASRAMVHTTKLETTKPLTPEQEHLEEQLRQELQQRKQQEELRGRLQHKDAEERAKLTSLRKELKGKDYTYDHKGEVVILNEFDPDKTPLESLSGPAFKVAAPAEDPVRTTSPRKRSMSRAASSKSLAGGAASPRGPGAGTAGLAGLLASVAPAHAGTNLSPSEMRKERERRLSHDFRKAPPKTQPSAMDSLLPAGGVTLRQGAATKSGPMKPTQHGITREAYQRQLARKAVQEERRAAEARASGLPPGMLLPAGGSATLDGPGGAASGMGLGLLRSTLGGQSSTTAAVIAAARAALAEQADRSGRDPLSAYEGEHDLMKDAKPKRHAAVAAAQQQHYSGGAGSGGGSSSRAVAAGGPPDMNLVLTGAGDWGSGGGGRGFEPAPALHASKPTDRTVAKTVGRTDRLPRERAPLATLAPPLSPSKAGTPKDTSRLQFTSILSGN